MVTIINFRRLIDQIYCHNYHNQSYDFGVYYSWIYICFCFVYNYTCNSGNYQWNKYSIKKTTKYKVQSVIVSLGNIYQSYQNFKV